MELISRDEVMRLAESGKLLSGSYGERAKDIIKAIPTIKLRKMKVEECEGHSLDYAMGWKACIEWLESGGDNQYFEDEEVK